MSRRESIDDAEILEDDYYALLNLDKDASIEDITNAYRRLSRLYHPDKHMDPEKKEQAEILFNKTKTAYEVLSDPHMRAIYDTLGVKGIETDGWMIIERTKTAQEIREEYEQLVNEREERRLQQQANPKGTLIIGVNATDIFDVYDEFRYPTIEIGTMSITQSVEVPLTASRTLSLNGSLVAQNGIGSHSIGCTYRNVISARGWIEMGCGAGEGFVFSLKGFRHFAHKCFGSLQGSFHFSPIGIVPGLHAVVGKQITKEVSGYMTWKAGTASLMKTTVTWHSSNGHLLTTDLQFGLRASFISFSYKHKFSDDLMLKGSIKAGPAGGSIEYGCEKKVFKNSILGATMALGVPSGVTLKLKLNHANHTCVIPILLSDEVLPSAVFYGTVAPLVGWFMLKSLIINPYQEMQKKRLQEKNAAKLEERRKEALIAVNLMQETYKRIRYQEEAKKGLIIIEALYGSPEDVNSADETSSEDKKLFDVTVQLQCLVKDSRLILPGRSKSNLPGFFDPCLGEEKCLLINYSYRSIAHSITAKDEEVLRLPNER